MAGIALAATVGCGFTAQLGAMRISEEIDALEVMAIPSLPFLVTTRIIAGLIAVVPLYVIGLMSSYFATRLTVTQFFGQSAGTYDHYFELFLPPGDVLWSFGKVLVFAIVIILIHCYHGYTASGGPAGVGVAVGRAVRTSIVAINVIDLLLSMAIWGTTTTVRLAGEDTCQGSKILGIAFLCVLMAGVWLTHAVFTKKFTPYDEVPCSPPRSACPSPLAPTSRCAASSWGRCSRPCRAAPRSPSDSSRTCGSRSPPTSPARSAQDAVR